MQHGARESIIISLLTRRFQIYMYKVHQRRTVARSQVTHVPKKLGPAFAAENFTRVIIRDSVDVGEREFPN